MSSPQLNVIKPPSGWQPIDWQELRAYRDLFYFLVWRDVKTRYAQSVLGIGWAVIQPVFHMIVFTIIFGNVAKISSDGAPYAVFSLTALVPWTYFAGTLTAASGSLVASSRVWTRVYFPRLVIPIAPALSKLVDFTITFGLLLGLMAWFGIAPTLWALALPLLIVVMMLTAVGMGLWLTALAVQYRDVNYALSFLVQLFMYVAPVVYPASLIPQRFRPLYALNPMAGVIEGFRSALLATRPMPWDLIAIGTVSAAFLALTGALYFRRMEKVFADVV